MPAIDSRALILASGSPYRKQQLTGQLSCPLSAIAPDIDESPIANEHPAALALRLSEAKARAVAGRAECDAIIIAGDQAAEFNGQLLSKPGSAAAACAQLASLSNQRVNFYSGICVFDTMNSKCLCDTVTTEVKFRPLDSATIEAYVRRDRPWDCVGAFKNESLGIALLTEVRSKDPSALTGLPLIRLIDFLKDMGIDLIRG